MLDAPGWTRTSDLPVSAKPLEATAPLAPAFSFSFAGGACSSSALEKGWITAGRLEQTEINLISNFYLLSYRGLI
jgi:hypothetical protein